MTKNIILTTWVFFILVNLQGQNVISLSVFDAMTKEPMPFVNIGIKNKNSGTISNSSGITVVITFKVANNSKEYSLELYNDHCVFKELKYSVFITMSLKTLLVTY